MIKYVEINCVSYFSINISDIVSSKFFGERARLNFGKVVVIFCVIPTVAYSVERSFCVLRRPKQTLKVPWVRIASVMLHYYVLNVLMSTDQILKK